MGLDITAYKKIERSNDAKMDEDGYPEDYDNYMKINVNSFYVSHALPFLHDEIYTTGTESHGFRAGSYGGYSAWRRELAKMSNCQKSGDAFFELVNFSDCEGCIGSDLSKKLAKDFSDFEEKAKEHKSDFNDRFYDLYKEWKIAFEFGADNGLVDFH